MYRTRDLGLAAYLAVKGHAFTLDLDPVDARSVWFEFPPEAAADKDGWFGDGAVPSRAFYAQTRALKTRVAGFLRGG